jgi:hypothetical protein
LSWNITPSDISSPKVSTKSMLPTLNPVEILILVSPKDVAAYKKPLSSSKNTNG